MLDFRACQMEVGMENFQVNIVTNKPQPEPNLYMAGATVTKVILISNIWYSIFQYNIPDPWGILMLS